MKYQQNNNCLICNEKIQIQYLNLGNQPLANSYHKGENLTYYPLQIELCTSCWHSQLSVSVSPEEMFDHYLYISDTTKTLTKYFEDTTEYILSKLQNSPNQVLEIACNSGTLLEMFQKKNLRCYGVDPAKNIRPLSEQRNLDVFVEYWNIDFAKKLQKEVGNFDLIMAFHVLPHVNNPNDFIKACKTILSETGVIFLQTSQCDMFLNNEFDVIYHEHSSYFTGKSIKTLARNHGLWVSSIIKTDIHGKSFLFSLQKTECDESQLDKLIEEETQNGIYSVHKYVEFADNAQSIKQRLLELLHVLRESNYTIVGYGAAAKGNTLLNYIQYKFDYIIDDNSMKWGYLTPGMNIPITSILLLDSLDTKIAFIPLAWNFYKEIVERIQLVRDTKHDIFIRYFPTVKMETL